MIAPLAGFLAGSLHVLTGPDHLAAIAPLALRRGGATPPGSGSRGGPGEGRTHPAGAGWVIGFRWGLGHASGVLLIALFALGLRGVMPVGLISSWGERLVGVVLIGIGLWAIRRAFSSRVHAHEHDHEGLRHRHLHAHGTGRDHASAHAHLHTHAAFGVGVLHGVAGSSHILGVLPALALPTLVDAGGYVVAFCIATVASMAVFSQGVAWLSARFTAGGEGAYRAVVGCTAAAAILIGCVWLAGVHF
jgi:hypothetical protein